MFVIIWAFSNMIMAPNLHFVKCEKTSHFAKKCIVPMFFTQFRRSQVLLLLSGGKTKTGVPTIMSENSGSCQNELSYKY